MDTWFFIHMSQDQPRAHEFTKYVSTIQCHDDKNLLLFIIVCYKINTDYYILIELNTI